MAGVFLSCNYLTLINSNFFLILVPPVQPHHQYFHSTDQRKCPNHTVSQDLLHSLLGSINILSLLEITFLEYIFDPMTSQTTNLYCLSKVFKGTKLLSNTHSVTKRLPTSSKLISSMQITFHLNSNSLCFLNILCPFTGSGPLLFFALPVSLYLIYQMPLPISSGQKLLQLSSKVISYENTNFFW